MRSARLRLRVDPRARGTYSAKAPVQPRQRRPSSQVTSTLPVRLARGKGERRPEYARSKAGREAGDRPYAGLPSSPKRSPQRRHLYHPSVSTPLPDDSARLQPRSVRQQTGLAAERAVPARLPLAPRSTRAGRWRREATMSGPSVRASGGSRGPRRDRMEGNHRAWATLPVATRETVRIAPRPIRDARSL